MTEDNVSFDIEGIGNYYGGLTVKKEDGKHFWGIEYWNGMFYCEIPESLYLEILKHHNNPIQTSE